MSLRLVLASACAFSLFASQSLADSGTLLFAAPPLAKERPTEIRLSVYQESSGSPFEVQDFPPTPVPVPIDEPMAEADPSTEPEIVPGSWKSPFEIPLPEVPAELPAKSEVPAEPPVPSQEAAKPMVQPEVAAEPAVQQATPMEPEPTLAPSPVEEDRSDELESETPDSQLWEPIPVTPHGCFDEQPMVSCDPCCCPPRRFRVPRISCADLALPKLPQPHAFDEFGVDLGGWVEAGFSAAGTSPEDRFNGPVTFNDRHAEAQMNQLWFYLERKPDTWACSLDLGGRIDVMYGTDAQYIQAGDGLEANWEQSDRFYQMALPQFYLDATLAGWTVRMGKFFTILGYEGPAAPDNFFYSHAYTMQYGEPFTHTGMLVSRRFGQWVFNAGLHRGNDQFDDTDGLNALNFLGGVGYVAPGDRATVEYAVSSAESGPGVPSYTHSLVNTLHITEKLDYVLQGDYGEIWDDGRTAAWWGLNQYFTYTINPCWAAGVRVEWFRDRDGARVSGIRTGNQTPTGLAGDFYEITLGMNWKPRTNLRIRPEVRWDIFDPAASTTAQAYDAGNLNRQFTFGCDVIYKF